MIMITMMDCAIAYLEFFIFGLKMCNFTSTRSEMAMKTAEHHMMYFSSTSNETFFFIFKYRKGAANNSNNKRQWNTFLPAEKPSSEE